MDHLHTNDELRRLRDRESVLLQFPEELKELFYRLHISYQKKRMLSFDESLADREKTERQDEFENAKWSLHKKIDQVYPS